MVMTHVSEQSNLKWIKGVMIWYYKKFHILKKNKWYAPDKAKVKCQEKRTQSPRFLLPSVSLSLSRRVCYGASGGRRPWAGVDASLPAHALLHLRAWTLFLCAWTIIPDQSILMILLLRFCSLTMMPPFSGKIKIKIEAQNITSSEEGIGWNECARWWLGNSYL